MTTPATQRSATAKDTMKRFVTFWSARSWSQCSSWWWWGEGWNLDNGEDDEDISKDDGNAEEEEEERPVVLLLQRVAVVQQGEVEVLIVGGKSGDVDQLLPAVCSAHISMSHNHPSRLQSGTKIWCIQEHKVCKGLLFFFSLKWQTTLIICTGKGQLALFTVLLVKNPAFGRVFAVQNKEKRW